MIYIIGAALIGLIIRFIVTALGIGQNVEL